jgi:hypothetical protein
MRLISLTAVCLVTIFSSAMLAGDNDNRNLWVYEGGWYQRKDGKHWIEVNAHVYSTGKTYRYVEVKRTKAYVEIFDEERNIRARLLNSTQEFRDSDGQWKSFYKGRWKK